MVKRLSQTDQNGVGLIGNDASTSYKGSVQLAGDLGGTAASPTVIPATFTTPGKLRQLVFNINDYGSVGNSSTGDTSVIQSAMNAVGTAGGGKLYFPHGTYYIGTALTPVSDVSLIGDGTQKTIFRYISTSSATNMIANTSNVYSDIEIAGISFDAVDHNGAGIMQLGTITKLHIHDCEYLNVLATTAGRWPLRIGIINDADVEGSASYDVEINDCLFKNNSCDGFEVVLLPNVRESWMHDNRFLGNTTELTDEVSIYSDNVNFRYTNNIHRNFTYYAVGAKQSDSITISDNTFYQDAGNAAASGNTDQRAIRSYNLINSKIQNNLIVMDGSNSTNGWGIYLQDRNIGSDGHAARNANSYNIKVSGNTIVNAYFGIGWNLTGSNYSFGYSDINITDNDFYNIIKTPIRIGPNTTGVTLSIHDIHIKRNNIYGWSGDFEGGIGVFGDTTDATMLSNVFIENNFVANNTTGTTSGGIRLSAATVATVSNNVVTASGSFSGVSLANGATIARKFNNAGDDSGGIESITGINGNTLYRTTDKITNYERGTFFWNGTTLTLVTQAAGTGTARSILIAKGSSDGSILLQGASPWVSIGTQSAKNGASTILTAIGMGTLSLSGAGTQYGAEVAPTISQGSTAGYTALLINPTESATGSGTKLLLDAQVGGSPKFSIANDGTVIASNKITNVTNPTSAQDAATKSYVDSATGSGVTKSFVIGMAVAL